MQLNWQPLDNNKKEIPSEWYHWLVDIGSLTAKLREHCQDFAVHLLAQQQRKAEFMEQQLLGLSQGDQIIEREVQLYCHGQPVIYANSLIPVTVLVDRFKDLDSLGEQPLGEKIFSDPQLERSPIEWTLLTTDSHLYADATQGLEVKPKQIYGRRSLFSGAEKPILISEFYLPAIVDLD